MRRKRGSGSITAAGYIAVQRDGVLKTEHLWIAEQVLGRQLPDGAEIHHVDGNKSNNRHDNLVICPNKAYHMMLHARTRALDECGNASWLKCPHCKKYDARENLFVGKGGIKYHRACKQAYYKRWKASHV